MSPAEIIREAQADGVCLALGSLGTIKATGDGPAVNRWLAVIRENKVGIVEAMTVGEVESTQRSTWLLHFPDSDPLSVSFCPAVTHTEALARYPQAIAAEPTPERTRRTATVAEARELRGLIEAVYCNDPEADQAEALQAAISDPDRALICYRAICARHQVKVPKC